MKPLYYLFAGTAFMLGVLVDRLIRNGTWWNLGMAAVWTGYILYQLQLLRKASRLDMSELADHEKRMRILAAEVKASVANAQSWRAVLSSIDPADPTRSMRHGSKDPGSQGTTN